MPCGTFSLQPESSIPYAVALRDVLNVQVCGFSRK